MISINPLSLWERVKACPALDTGARAFSIGIALICLLLLTGCASEVSGEPRDLLLAPDDFSEGGVSVVSLSEEQSLDGPSAQAELQGPGFRVVQSLILYENREMSLAALDGIRADLVNQGQAAPGELEASGVFDHQLGNEAAASLFFIEGRALVRLTVTGPERRQRLTAFSALARDKLAGS